MSFYIITFEKEFNNKESQEGLEAVLNKFQEENIGEFHQFYTSPVYSLTLEDDNYLEQLRSIPGLIIENKQVIYKTQAEQPLNP